jgi:hypothetical protein
MKKIPSLFVRDWDSNPDRVTDQVTEGCEWVMAGEGMPTQKWDGTAVLVRDGKLFARYDCKRGKTPPEGFEPCGEPDPKTGHHPGWVPATRPDDKWIRKAYEYSAAKGDVEDGTYEAIGPKINGNNERVDEHMLQRHGSYRLLGIELSYEGIRDYLSKADIEGIVWHHPDGRMVKIKTGDFGLRWPTP